MSDDEARRIIMARRARFVAAALASAGIATAACGGETTDPGPRSGAGGQGEGGGATGGAPLPCLTPAAGGVPQVCLSILPEGGAEGPSGDASTDAMPMPCLR